MGAKLESPFPSLRLPKSKLTAIRKQIATLEGEAARISQVEIKAAIAKVKDIMSAFGLTIEHLSGAISKVGKKPAGKKAAAKRAGVSVAKYADPKTGKTWSGFGRAPAWIAGAKSRDAFLITKSDAAASGAAPAKAKASAKKSKAVAAKKASPVNVAKSVKTEQKPAAKAPATKKPAGKTASTTAAKSPVAKKKAKAPAKKVAARKSPSPAAAEPASAASASTAA
jgi:DNA-binding protein H-NS